MTIEQIKECIGTKEYDFLRNNENLGNNVILLGLGGSYAYGTNHEGSDLDIRGCAVCSREQLLCGEDFEQVIDERTDTTVYSVNKLFKLLKNSNPNTIEMLGLKPEHYLILSPSGRELLENTSLFLSQRAAYSFGAYAFAQLRRLDNKAARDVSDPRERHLVRDYNRLGKSTQQAMDHGKLGKHMMHLIRLYIMCLDILETEKVVTYREKEHDMLMEIRNGKYLNEQNRPIPEFFEMVDEYEKKVEYAKNNTGLPEKPNEARIRELLIHINEQVVKEAEEKEERMWHSTKVRAAE